MENSRLELNKNLAQMLKGGVIMDVTTPEQAKICLLYTSQASPKGLACPGASQRGASRTLAYKKPMCYNEKTG